MLLILNMVSHGTFSPSAHPWCITKRAKKFRSKRKLLPFLLLILIPGILVSSRSKINSRIPRSGRNSACNKVLNKWRGGQKGPWSFLFKTANRRTQINLFLQLFITNTVPHTCEFYFFWGITCIDKLLHDIKITLKELFYTLIDPHLSNYVIFNFEKPGTSRKHPKHNFSPEFLKTRARFPSFWKSSNRPGNPDNFLSHNEQKFLFIINCEAVL